MELITLKDKKVENKDIGKVVWNFLCEKVKIVGVSKSGDIKILRENDKGEFDKKDEYSPEGLLWNEPITISKERYKELLEFEEDLNFKYEEEAGASL